MDMGSESSKEELDSINSITSADSLQVLTEFRLRHSSTPDATNAELSKKVAALELDNERLLVDFENARLELSAKNAANQGLKSKIAELYVEAQTSLQVKQKLQNRVNDAECKLAAAEHSVKWYQGQVHEVQANNKTLQVEIDTYQNMLKQKSLTLMNVTAKYKQLSDDYTAAVQRHKQEKDVLQDEIDLLRTRSSSIMGCSLQAQTKQQPQPSVPTSAYAELSRRLRVAEDELRESRAAARGLEQRVRSLDEERAAAEAGCAKQRIQLSAAEEKLRFQESERGSLAESCRGLRVELGRLGSEQQGLQVELLSSRQERAQVEQAIEQLQSQLSKMIAQHRLLRSRNAELEEKMAAMQGVSDENRRLKSLSYSANASLFRKLRQERRKLASLQRQLCQEQARQRVLAETSKTDASLRDSLRQALERNKELREQLKSTKMSEESVDEGYADGSSVASLSLTNLPSPRPLSPRFLSTVNDVLVKSKNFWEPIKLGLDEMQAKLDDCKIEKIQKIVPVPSTCYIPTPPSSPSSDAHSVA